MCRRFGADNVTRELCGMRDVPCMEALAAALRVSDRHERQRAVALRRLCQACGAGAEECDALFAPKGRRESARTIKRRVLALLK